MGTTYFSFEAIFEAISRPRLSKKKRDDLRLALQLFEIYDTRQIWYSENYPTTPNPTEIVAAYWRWEPKIRPFYQTEEPTYHYTRHPLTELHKAARMLWLWYRLPEAEALLQHALGLSQSLKTPRGIWISSHQSMCEHYEERRTYALYEGDFHQIDRFFLAEIAEKRGDQEAALGFYRQFLEIEPRFAPTLPWGLNNDFFYMRVYPPNSIEAARRVGRILEEQGRREESAGFYAYALALNFTHQSPIAERAAQLRADGRGQEADNLELTGLLGSLGVYEGRDRRWLGFDRQALDLMERGVLPVVLGVEILRRIHSSVRHIPGEVDFFLPEWLRLALLEKGERLAVDVDARRALGELLCEDALYNFPMSNWGYTHPELVTGFLELLADQNHPSLVAWATRIVGISHPQLQNDYYRQKYGLVLERVQNLARGFLPKSG